MHTSLPPDTICGYTVLRSLAPTAYVALADGGRQVFLKPLDIDCLLHGQLHPSIKERLARVRELALKSTANLHGVERDSSAENHVAGKAGVFLVWEFIDGDSLESRAEKISPFQLISMLREVVLSLEALHQVGIVHGALHARNIIIDPAGRPRLTHISPLLFDDPTADESAMSSMIASLVEKRTDIDSATRLALIKPAPLRELASRFIKSDMPQDQSDLLDGEDARRRRRTLLLATAIACLGILIAVVTAFFSRRI